MDKIPSPAAHLFVDDPEALAGAIQGTTLRPVRLSGAGATSELARLILPTSCFDFARIGTAMLFTGAMTEHAYTLVFVLDCPETGRSFNFSTDHNDGFIGFFPPGGQIDAVTPAGYANATLTVPTDVFLAAIERHCPEIPESLLAHGVALRIPAADQVPLRLLVAEVHRLIAARSTYFTDPHALQLIEQEILAAFLRAFRGGSEHPVPAPHPRVARREHLLGESREMIEAHLDSPLSTPDIASAVGLSTRGLEVLFRDLLGLSPAAYVRHRRLHAARRVLLEAETRPGLVKEVALDHGFWHFGRFARDYRLFFGENPSETAAPAMDRSDQ